MIGKTLVSPFYRYLSSLLYSDEHTMVEKFKKSRRVRFDRNYLPSATSFYFLEDYSRECNQLHRVYPEGTTFYCSSLDITAFSCKRPLNVLIFTWRINNYSGLRLS